MAMCRVVCCAALCMIRLANVCNIHVRLEQVIMKDNHENSNQVTLIVDLGGSAAPPPGDERARAR